MSGYRFPDVPSVMCAALATLGTPHLVLPAEYKDALPAIHVEGMGGDAEGPFRTDRVRVSVYDQGRDQLRATAEQIRAHLTAGPVIAEGEVLDDVDCIVLPTLTPWNDQGVLSYVAEYVVDTRGL